MEEEYSEVVSNWELARIDIGSLRLQIEKKKERKGEILDKLKKVEISIESKKNSLKEQKSLLEEKPLTKEKAVNLEKKIDLLKSKISDAEECERNAQICLSKEAFSDASVKCIQQTCRKRMQYLLGELAKSRSEKDATIKQYEVSNDYSEKLSLRRKESTIAENMARYELDMNTKSKVLTLFNILHSGISVEKQWYNAVQNLKELTPKIEMLSLQLEELPVPTLMEEKQQKQKYEDTIRDLKLKQEKELKTISTFDSILSKIDLDPRCENKSFHQEDTEGISGKPTQTINRRDNKNKTEKNNDREDGNDKETHKLEDVNPNGMVQDVEESQNEQNNSKLADERFQNAYGIIIESISNKDLSYEAEPWNSDERLDVLERKEFPDMLKLYTDIFHIRESTAENNCERNIVSATYVRFKVLLPTENSLYNEYKGVIKVGKVWKRIDYNIKDGYMVFEVDEVDSFCVLSLVRQEKHVILPAGSQFISEIDNRIQVKFPPNAVTKAEHITFMIHPPSISCMKERTKEIISINAMTPGISTIHIEFKKMFKIQLPLQSITDVCGDTEDYIYYICKWKEDGSLELTDLQPLVNNGLVCFEANSFSGYGCVQTRRSNSTSSMVSFVQEAYELRKWCKILFFVGKMNKYNLPIMLECVERQRVSDVCEKRETYGYQFVPEWISKDLFLHPAKTILTIDVKGIFKIPKESSVKTPRISFIPVAEDNFTRILVELVQFGTLTYGILGLRENRTTHYEIFYHPDATKKLLPPKVTGNQGRKPVETLRPLIVPNPNERGQRKQQNSRKSVPPEFFTETGLSALSNSMSPDTMFNVCLWMDMTTSTYDTVQYQFGSGTKRGNIELLKIALNQQPDKKKLEKLLKALKESGQTSLADKLHQLHLKGKPLNTI